MAGKNNTRFRKVLAGLFLLLFAVVYTGKLIHHHDNSITSDQQSSHFVTAANCDTCDFKLTQEGELPAPLPLQLPAQLIIIAKASYLSFYNSTHASLNCNRGPPNPGYLFFV